MLQSILHGKSRNADGPDGVPQSVGALFRKLEDARTSTIFERLAYLPPTVGWNLLRLSCNNAIPEFRLVELADVKFWPNWQIVRSGRQMVEPDVYMRWVVGDPSIIIDLIIEAKLPGAISQSPQQWLDQLEGYRDFFCAPDDDDSDRIAIITPDCAHMVFHMSVDGLGANPHSQLKSLIPSVLPDALPEVRFVACSWQTLAEALDSMDRLGGLDEVPRPLVEDLRKAFDYCGHQAFRIADGIFRLDTQIGYENTMSALADWRIS